MGGKEPIYISVIIIAYNRKEFLLNAIKSVLNQTLDKKYYEIIVVKNFEDKTIDDFISSNKIINILSNKIDGISKYIGGLEIAKGNIISFLDDDDSFLSNKLEIVYNKFKNDDNLVYYHNDHITINEKYEKLNNNINSSIQFNISSISVRKSISNLDNLKKIHYAQDDFMYLSALESHKNIIDGKEKLTYYMWHNSISNSVSSNFKGYRKFIITTSDLALNDYILFNNLFHSKKAIKFLNSQTTGVQIYKYIYGSNELPNKLINYIINGSGSLKYRVLFFLACILIKVYPKSHKYISYKIWSIHSKRANETI